MPSRDKLFKDIMDNSIKALGPNATFNFSCQQCGACCLDRVGILLNPYDINRICKHLGISAVEMLSQYTEVYIGHTSNVPLIRLKSISGEYKHKKRNICVFLHTDGAKYKCLINETKPTVCALYPLGRFFEFNKEGSEKIGKVSYFFQDDACQGRLRKYTLKQWMTESNLEGSEEASLVFNKFLGDLFQKIDFKGISETQHISEEAKDHLYNSMVYYMYVKPTEGKDFYEDMKLSLDRLTDLLLAIVDKLAKDGLDFRK